MRPPAFAARLVTVMALLTLTLASAEARPTPKPSPAIFTRSVLKSPNGRPDKRGEDWTVDLVARKDGTFMAGRDGERIGRLTPVELATLQKAIRKTRFIKDTPNRPVCTGMPNRSIRIRTTHGSVSWAAPCARGPHRSVVELEHLVESMVRTSVTSPPEPRPETPEAPGLDPSALLVTVSINSMRGVGEFESLAVHADGTWQRVDARLGGTGRGQLTAGQLVNLRSRLAAVSLHNPAIPPACAARLDGHGEVSIPGVGSHTWNIPCSNLSPSLSSLLTELRRLTAPTP